MLVLSRKIGERILIGDDIEVMIVDVRSLNHVRVGVYAPSDVPIVREELRDVFRKVPPRQADGDGPSIQD